MRKLSRLLQQDSRLKAWQVSRLRRATHELYTSGGATEAFRCSQLVEYSLAVHTPGAAPEKIGESTATFQPQAGQLAQIIREAIERAALVQNPAYEFSALLPAQSKINPMFDSQLAEDPSTHLLHTGEEILSLTREELSGCRLASFELFLEHSERAYLNSNGQQFSVPATRITWDFVLESPNGEFEINSFSRRRFLEHYNFRKVLISEAAQLRDIEQATLPPTGNFPVVLADEALDTLFDYFLAQADGAALYNRYSSFKVGEPVLPGEALEPLTLSSDPWMPGGMNSNLYDSAGYPMKPVTVVAHGIMNSFLIDGRYSGLLKQPMTSAAANTRVAPGKTAAADFISDGVIELRKFSTFQPNTITGAFSGEIRLGYLHRRGQKIPLRGGSVSGDLRHGLLRARFSRETEQRAAYHGPQAVFFESLTLAGA